MSLKYAPREVFEHILEWGVIPTFDIVIEFGDLGVILVKRNIVPYQNQWALPGLRMFKGEEIRDVLQRIAADELGLKIDVEGRVLLGQFVGKFKTEHSRQDLSTGYVVKCSSKLEIKLNTAHFSSYTIIKSGKEIPRNIGAMYRFYLEKYFSLKEKINFS